MLWPTVEPGPARIEKLNAEAAAEPGAAFSPDGSTIAFAGAGGVHLLTLSAGAAVPLPGSLAGDASPAFSPDGATVAVVRRPSSICLLPVKGGGGRCLETPGASAGVDWSRDGNRLVVSIAEAGTQPALHWIDAAGGAPIRLSPQDSGDRWPAMSPRGGAVAFLRDGVYWIYELTDKPPAVRRTRKLGARGEAPADWSPDSRFLYYAAGGRIWRIGFNATARPQRVGDVEGAAGRVAVAGTGRRLVFSRRSGDGAELFLLTGF